MEKNGRNAFPTGAKIHFSEKNLGVRGTLNFLLILSTPKLQVMVETVILLENCEERKEN